MWDKALQGQPELNSAVRKENNDYKGGTSFPNDPPNGSAGHSLESRWPGRQTAFEYSVFI